MEQLIFELAPPEPPSFANFVAGPNARGGRGAARSSRGRGCARPASLLWGAAGVGQARICCARRSRRPRARAAGRATCAGPDAAPAEPPAPARWSPSTTSTRRTPTAQGAAVHAVQRAAGDRRPPARGGRGAAGAAARCATTCARGSAGGWSTRSCRSPTPTSRRRWPRYARARGFRWPTTSSPTCSRMAAAT